MSHCYYAEILAIEYEHGRIVLGPECCVQEARPYQLRLTEQMSQALPATLEEFMQRPEYYLDTYSQPATCLSCTCPYSHDIERPRTNFRKIKVSIDGSCNLQCLHCYIDKRTRIYDPIRRQAQLRCLDWAKKHTETIHLTIRGEPFISGEQGYTAKWLLALNESDPVRRIEALSNYTLLTPALQDQLWQHLQSQHKELHVAASCDAFDQAHYEQIRQGGNFVTTINNMQHAHELGLLQLINYVMMPWNEEVTDTIGEQLLALGFDPQRFPLAVEMIPYRDYDSTNYRNTVVDKNGQIINEHFRNALASLQRCGFTPATSAVGKKKE